MPDLDPNWPGRHHEVTQTDGVFRVVATEAFARRDRPTVAATIVVFLFAGGPAIWYALRADDTGLAVALWGWVALLALFFVRPALLPSPPRDPLGLTRGGRIEYRGVLLLAGPVMAVRIVRRPDGADNPDTLHLVCDGADGHRAELPAPDFGGTTDLRELVLLAVWLANLFGVPRPTVVERIAEGLG